MARRKRDTSIASTPAPAPASPSPPGRGWWWVGGLMALAAVAAWWLAGVIVARAAAQRLPALPPQADVPPAAYAQLEAADRAARVNSTALTIGELAMIYHASLRPAEALAAYAAADLVASGDERFQYYRALLLIEQAEHAGAIAALRGIGASSAHYAIAQLHLGEALLKIGDGQDARRALETARERGAVIATSIEGLPPRKGGTVDAHAAFALARLDQAATAPPPAEPPPLVDPLLDALAARSRHSDFLLKHAALAARSGDRPWREWLARRALDAQPNGLDVLLEMASAMQDKDAHADALTFLARAESVAPGDHHTLVEQGQSLTALGRLDEAERVLRRAVRVRDASAEYNLATVLDMRNQWPEAQQRYERALAINPYHARALNNLGIGLGRRGNAAAAAELYRRAIAIGPTDPDPLTNLSGALMTMGRFEEALAAADSALTLNPNLADAHNNRGICLARLGRPASAREAFAKAVRADPLHQDARRNLALLGGSQ